ncbi:MAG: peptidoglycan DD-metalloendopeptidase family protein [Pseudomonadota bacterium]|nr:peptidoglycan DD-metalloendopeptidase family protein [Pseudomonadota bacterium]
MLAQTNAAALRVMAVGGVLLLAVSACTRSTVVRNERPASPGAVQAQPAARAAQTATPQARVSQPKYGATHVVQRGETVYRIATQNGITPLDLALWNNVPPPYTIYPGQRLRLYPRDATASNQAARPATPSARPTAPAAGTPASTTVTTPSPAVSRIAWQWPVSGGQIVSTYLANDTTRQGIDISGNGGEPVRAAADGTVVYSGSGLVGYGELIIIKHDEQWLSAYGHNRRRMVNEGALVKAGQQIGELGSSGAPRNMLHFEIRQNGKPVDPQLYLPRR